MHPLSKEKRPGLLLAVNMPLRLATLVIVLKSVSDNGAMCLPGGGVAVLMKMFHAIPFASHIYVANYLILT